MRALSDGHGGAIVLDRPACCLASVDTRHMSQNTPSGLALCDLVGDFATGMKLVDARAPIATNARSGTPYQPGIGPHTEAQTVRLVMGEVAVRYPDRYSSFRLDVPYGDGSRQACDLCIGDQVLNGWAAEVKMLRLMGDNGKLNDNMITHILSPYPQHRSALTDCSKLVASALAEQKAILIYGYDYPGWSMDPAIDAFQTLARQRVRLSKPAIASISGLVHPVHQQGQVFGWQIWPA